MSNGQTGSGKTSGKEGNEMSESSDGLDIWGRVDIMGVRTRGEDGGKKSGQKGGGGQKKRAEKMGGMEEEKWKPNGASLRYLKHLTPSQPGQLGRAGGPSRSAH